MARGGTRGSRGGHRPYEPLAWSDESSRTLLNWLSTRVTADGKECHSDHIYEWREVERCLRLAAAHGLTVPPGTYLPCPVSEPHKEPRRCQQKRAG
jgi:hypothetical protein